MYVANYEGRRPEPSSPELINSVWELVSPTPVPHILLLIYYCTVIQYLTILSYSNYYYYYYSIIIIGARDHSPAPDSKKKIFPDTRPTLCTTPYVCATGTWSLGPGTGVLTGPPRVCSMPAGLPGLRPPGFLNGIEDEGSHKLPESQGIQAFKLGHYQ